MKKSFLSLMMGKKFVLSVFLFLMLFGCSPLSAQSLNVYPTVPGLSASEFYSFRVRLVGSSTWQTSFAFITRCIVSNPVNDATKYYCKYLGGWSNTYINFEMAKSTQVEIEISKVNGNAITKAAAHPQHKVISCNVVDGKAYVVIDNPALFAVDIDGQMDDQNTGRLLPEGWGIPSPSLYSGPPIHTVTIFANPIISDKPSISDPNVYVVNPGDSVNANFTQSTLYFKPGVHDVGKNFQLHANKSYYIPGDAIVYGTFNNNFNSADGDKIRIFGHGTLSGARVRHPDDDKALEADRNRYRPIDIRGKNVTVEGITIADSPMHSLMILGAYDPVNPCYIRWVKIFTWRANGDGINPFGNVGIEDCFIRTQDDCTYTNGLGMKRLVIWTDANGSAFVLSPQGRIDNPNLVIEDCDIIYSRSVFQPNGKGGCVFNARAEGGPNSNNNPLTFRNIRIEDKRRTRSVFNLKTAWEGAYNQAPGDLKNIFFEDITIAGTSVTGDKETLWGYSGAPIHDCTFKNVVFADSPPLFDIDNFTHNEYVYDLKFLFSGVTWNLTTTAVNGSINPSSRTYPNGANVTLTAIPNLGYEFTGWSGDITGTTNPVVVTMNKNKSITANFKTVSTFTLTVNASNAIVELTPAGGVYNPGTVVSILIKPNLAYVFSGWSGDLTGTTNPATMTMNSNKTVTATITSVPVYKLTAIAPNGTVTFEPAGPEYSKGTIVKVTAKANPGFTFSYWSGDPLNDEFYINPNFITMNSDKNIAANFAAQVGVPTVSFTKPLDGEKFTEPANLTVNVDAKAATGGSISNVKLYVNGVFVRQENSAPYDWSSTGDVALQNLQKGIYVLRADATDNSGKIGSKSITITVGDVTGINQEKIIPTETMLNQNYPNPFNPETTISYQLAEPSHARITIRNTLGQEVNKLVDRDQSTGHYSVTWNGRDLSGNKVSSGIYFYVLEVNNSIFAKKLVLLQ